MTLREKQAIWMLKKPPATEKSAEKTTVDDDRQIIKAVKMNPKRRICKASRKLGWCSDNPLSSGDFDTELQMLQKDANLWPATKIERQD